jgi:adenosylhomocysteine nucleosidase
MTVAETLVAVPQAKELEPLVGALVAAGCQPRSLRLGRLECHLFDELRMLFVVGGHGKTQLAVQTQHLIEQKTDLQAVICAGAAGSLDPGLRLGDVVVGTSTIEHDYKLRFVQRPLPSHQADVQLLGEFRSAAGDIGREFRVFFGAIASGDEDIVDPARALELRQATGALCVAWEGAGAARAASFSKLQFLEMRVITDAADQTAGADFQTNLKRTMPNLAHLLLKWSFARQQPNTRPLSIEP